MVDNAQGAGNQLPPAQVLLGQEQLEQEGERPLYITTASTYIEEADTKYNWIKTPPIICIGLSDLHTATRL